MLARRELRPLLAVAVLGVVLAGAVTAGGLGDQLLFLAPALVLLLPLLAGRYVGEDRLHALAAAVGRRHRPASAAVPVAARRARLAVVRGGRLLAVSLARRGPPAAIAAR